MIFEGYGILRLALCTALTLWIAALASPLKAELVQAPNSRVVLDLPPGFVPTPKTGGFTHESGTIEIVIVERPIQDYQSIASKFTPEAFSQRGLKNITSATLPRSGQYFYFRAEEELEGKLYDKYNLLFSEEHGLSIIIIMVQKASDADKVFSRDAVEKTLASARIVDVWSDPRRVFRVRDTGPFKISASFPNLTLVYTIGGRSLSDQSDGTPLVVVKQEDRVNSESDLESVTQKLLENALTKNLQPISSRRLGLNEIKGFEREASGANDSLQLQVYIAVFARPKGALIVLATGKSEDMMKYAPDLKRLTESVVPVN